MRYNSRRRAPQTRLRSGLECNAFAETDVTYYGTLREFSKLFANCLFEHAMAYASLTRA
jgi:hypothetical protein